MNWGFRGNGCAEEGWNHAGEPLSGEADRGDAPCWHRRLRQKSLIDAKKKLRSLGYDVPEAAEASTPA